MAGWNGVLMSGRGQLLAAPAEPGAPGPSPGSPAGAVAAARRRRARLQLRRGRGTPDGASDPVLSEEEAVDLLYGRRTGTVVASPASPPLG
jgi:hypothetical protein